MDAEVERLRQRRAGAGFLMASGFALLFLGGLGIHIAIGGAVSVLLGAVGWLYWGRRMRKLKGDPWDYDPELDGPSAPEWARR